MSKTGGQPPRQPRRLWWARWSSGRAMAASVPVRPEGAHHPLCRLDIEAVAVRIRLFPAQMRSTVSCRCLHGQLLVDVDVNPAQLQPSLEELHLRQGPHQAIAAQLPSQLTSARQRSRRKLPKDFQNRDETGDRTDQPKPDGSVRCEQGLPDMTRCWSLTSLLAQVGAAGPARELRVPPQLIVKDELVHLAHRCAAALAPRCDLRCLTSHSDSPVFHYSAPAADPRRRRRMDESSSRTKLSSLHERHRRYTPGHRPRLATS